MAAAPGFAQNAPSAKKSIPQGAANAPAPNAPQSTHFPILLLAFGSSPTWDVRIGPKGPELLQRQGYPPILLEPGEISREGASDVWTYRAKDAATGADVAVHLSRESCSDASSASGARYTFRAMVSHSQIGILNGCARIAAELFPRMPNQSAQVDSDDPDNKKQPILPPITTAKLPVAVAYLTPQRKLMFKRGAVARAVAQEGDEPSLSRDGKLLLYRVERKSDDRTILLYDTISGKSMELLRGSVRQPSWSPDNTRFAFTKFVDGKWRLWLARPEAPGQATQVFNGEISVVDGWADAHTILVDDLAQLLWIGDDGRVTRAIPEKEILGDAFSFSSANRFRVHPLNPDLLLVSAEWTNPPAGVPRDPEMGGGFGFFLYELHAKRRVVLSPPDMFSQDAEWSHDGLQIFFTGGNAAGRYATYRMLWDGSGLRRYQEGSGLVVGQ